MTPRTGLIPDMTHLQEAKAFRDAYGLKTPDPSAEQLQFDLIGEEFVEFCEASIEEQDEGQDPAHTLKELSDLVFVCYQYAAARGWNLDLALTRVFESNMSKLGIDGKPILREDGKILKGPGYFESNLTDLV